MKLSKQTGILIVIKGCYGNSGQKSVTYKRVKARFQKFWTEKRGSTYTPVYTVMSFTLQFFYVIGCRRENGNKIIFIDRYWIHSFYFYFIFVQSFWWCSSFGISSCRACLTYSFRRSYTQIVEFTENCSGKEVCSYLLIQLVRYDLSWITCYILFVEDVSICSSDHLQCTGL